MEVLVASNLIEMASEAFDKLLAVAPIVIDAQHLEKMPRGREPLEGSQRNLGVQGESDVLVDVEVTLSTIEGMTLKISNFFLREMV